MDTAQRFRRRVILVAAALLLAWMVVIAVVAGVASGYWGDLGLPTDDEGRPRGLLVIAAATVVAGTAIAIAYRRIGAPVSGLLHAADQVASGDYGVVDVEVRGPREVRLLAETFNEMAARLASNEAQRRRFMADITHELRNPLAVLQSEIEAQIDGVHPRDDHHLGSLLDETRRLGHLIDDLHTLALAETGRLSLQCDVVAVDTLIEEAVERHRTRARQRNATLRVSIEQDVPKVWADPTRIHQIMDNLLVNAIRHTPVGGEVLVTASILRDAGPGDRPMVRCQVTDAGSGFRSEQLGRLFEPTVRTGDPGGSGLGLSIARDLVRAHGGMIEAGNDPHTGGASVAFTLPT